MYAFANLCIFTYVLYVYTHLHILRTPKYPDTCLCKSLHIHACFTPSCTPAHTLHACAEFFENISLMKSQDYLHVREFVEVARNQAIRTLVRWDILCVVSVLQLKASSLFPPAKLEQICRWSVLEFAPILIHVTCETNWLSISSDVNGWIVYFVLNTRGDHKR